jgi:hypothetical protein
MGQSAQKQRYDRGGADSLSQRFQETVVLIGRDCELIVTNTSVRASWVPMGKGPRPKPRLLGGFRLSVLCGAS